MQWVGEAFLKPTTEEIHGILCLTNLSPIYTQFTLPMPIHGYVVGDEGYGSHSQGIIYKTTDGGITWSKSAITTDPLTSVCFTNTNTGYAVGRSGNIVKTIDGGTSWISVVSGTTKPLYSVYFPDANIGYAVGATGTILKTINGGDAWTVLNSGTTNDLYSVYMTGANAGYTVGAGLTILKTSNGEVPFVSPPNRNVSSPAGTTYFFVTSDTNWVITSDASWCTVTQSGSGNGIIAADYSENTSSSPRIANILVSIQALPLLEQTVTIIQVKSSVGIEEIMENDFQIWPNPSNGLFRIAPGMTMKGPFELTVRDLQGQVILRKQIQSDKEYEIDLSTATSRSYFIILKSDNRIYVRKLVIIR